MNSDVLDFLRDLREYNRVTIGPELLDEIIQQLEVESEGY